MKKIISLYQRNYDGDRLVRDEVVPGAEWVLAGEGTPTRKYDGTCCLVRDGMLYKRLDVKPGRTPPPDFEEEEHDEKTGKRFGWVPVGDGPEDRWHREAWADLPENVLPGTYELVGPKVQGNPERFDQHVLVPHGTSRASSGGCLSTMSRASSGTMRTGGWSRSRPRTSESVVRSQHDQA